MVKSIITITVDKGVLEKFKKICVQKDMKISTKINTLMTEWVSENEE